MKLQSPPGIQCEVNPQKSITAMPDFYRRLSRADLSYLPFHTDLLPLSAWGIHLLSVLVQPGAEVCKPLLQTQMLCESWLKQWVPLPEGKHVHRGWVEFAWKS